MSKLHYIFNIKSQRSRKRKILKDFWDKNWKIRSTEWYEEEMIKNSDDAKLLRTAVLALRYHRIIDKERESMLLKMLSLGNDDMKLAISVMQSIKPDMFRK